MWVELPSILTLGFQSAIEFLGYYFEIICGKHESLSAEIDKVQHIFI